MNLPGAEHWYLRRNMTRNLILTMEECGELIRACSKIIRHGTDDSKYIDNLIEEMGDVYAMLDTLGVEYNIDPDLLATRIQYRLDKMKRLNYE